MTSKRLGSRFKRTSRFQTAMDTRAKNSKNVFSGGPSPWVRSRVGHHGQVSSRKTHDIRDRLAMIQTQQSDSKSVQDWRLNSKNQTLTDPLWRHYGRSHVGSSSTDNRLAAKHITSKCIGSRFECTSSFRTAVYARAENSKSVLRGGPSLWVTFRVSHRGQVSSG